MIVEHAYAIMLISKKIKMHCCIKFMQAYLILLHLADIALFYKLKVYDNSMSSKSIGFIFSIAFVHFASLCHILAIFALFQSVCHCYICYVDM